MSITRVNTNTVNTVHLIDKVDYNFGGIYDNEIINRSAFRNDYNKEGRATLHLQHFFIFIGFIVFLIYVILLIRG